MRTLIFCFAVFFAVICGNSIAQLPQAAIDISPLLIGESVPDVEITSSKGKAMFSALIKEKPAVSSAMGISFQQNEKIKPRVLAYLGGRNTGFYDTFPKSYNIPEFVRTLVVLNKRELYRLIRTKPLNAVTDQ